MDVPTAITGEAAGVPFVAVPPAAGTPPGSAPVVVAWHMMDAPRTERAFAAALPLDGLDAWRIYLGLPMCGARLPAGGFEVIMRLGYEDAVLNLQGPVVTQAAEEFPAVIDELRARLSLGDGPLNLVGGSIGAAVALTVAAEGAHPVDSMVLVSPLVQLRPAVDAMARQFGFDYPWSPASGEIAARLDFVARADEIVMAGQPAVLVVVGEKDDPAGFMEPAHALRDALAARYAEQALTGDGGRGPAVPDAADDRVRIVVVHGMAHAIADEPGMEPAPQTPHAAEVDRHAVDWLRATLP
ncbi:alpha/beta fold hydrolase [Phytoactinopolyspora halotolerans]|uniref:Alpha/beta fold hydrolase n=1 Tax=Phytoactinopolyspora halotolerans TaxID=1981512 RepID=A0A6L9S214_9ACTN|nr:alpha/beta hydrolase [Phytoactinopolyspora halotolerans]NED99048.1 alpha/beta fold hydrolase [Phytoactinopolyspora halotolerans]